MSRTLDRREFLALSALAASPRTRGAVAQPTRPVVVVGAGLAGLQAATLLRKAGLPVIVLEARASVGGRVRTVRAPFSRGLFAEAGAIRIAGAHRTVIGLVREHGLTLVPFGSSAGSTVVSAGGVVGTVPDGLPEIGRALGLRADEIGLSQGALLQRYTTDVPAELDAADADPDTIRRWEALDRLAWPEWLASRGASPGAVTLMTLGGDSRDLSALYVLRQFASIGRTTEFFKIQGGMDRLPAKMAEALPGLIRFEASVISAERRPDEVRVDYVERGRRRSIAARRVIFTTPFSTLRHVEIRPSLPAAKAAAIQGLRYFPAARVMVEARERFWESKGLNGFARTDQPLEVWDSTHDLPGTAGVLSATAGGQLGESLSSLPRARAVAAGRALVAATFPDLATYGTHGSVYRWAVDPWARGAFAVWRPGGMAAVMPDVAAPDDRLHFAGEHTASIGLMGWMEGALQSGARAAREILSTT